MPSYPDSTIRMLFEDFKKNVLPDIATHLIRRDLFLGATPEPKIGNTVKVITGIRRCGKTFRLYQEMLDLMKNGVSPDRICYMNFDDDRLRPYTTGLIGHVLEVFYEMNPDARKVGAYIFFDEIQDIDDWEITMRRIVDTEKVTAYITGSSSQLLSDDIATEFRGRSVSYELAPLSFREYLRFKGIEFPNGEVPNDKESASLLKRELKLYLPQGGFPAAMNMDDIERSQLLQGYAQMTVSRDVVERMGFSNAYYARGLARTAITSSARDVSINRLDHKGRSSGYTPGRERIGALLDAFDSAHLVYEVYEFSYSIQKIRKGGVKLYAVDPGLYWAMSPATDDGLTFAFETAVYLDLRRRRQTARLGEVSMLKLKSGREVDFISGDATCDRASMLLQACFDMSDQSTFERESRALIEAMDLFGLEESYIVTMDQEEDISVSSGVIHVVPMWKWLLRP